MFEREQLMNWPSYFPNSCPPKDSSQTNGDVYRFVSDDTPTSSDFTSFWIKFPNRRMDFERRGQHCQCCGLSVAKSIEDLENKRKLVPRFKNMRIAGATLTPSDGRIRNTPMGRDKKHYTWWIPLDVEKPEQLFKVVV